MSNTKVSTVKTPVEGVFRTARCDDEGRLEVVVAGSSSPVTTSTETNISGTITLGGTAQNAAAANTSRIGFWIRNNSVASLWISTLATAVQSQPSLEIKPGELYETPPTLNPKGAISIIGPTTSQAWSGREW